ncbi:MAG: DUF6061 family protein [Eubacteriales bacterium]|nr:DUF6061 family protein [Eubacteriales bacterium]
MNRIVSCEFNMDTACVELCYIDGLKIDLDTLAIEDELADNLYDRSELDYLIYNKPLEYAELVLNGDLGKYLGGSPEHKLED